MPTRTTWFALYTLLLLILGASYSFLFHSFSSVSAQQEIDANQRLADKVDGNLNTFEAFIRQNEIEKAKVLLKAIGKNEKVVCTSLLVGQKVFTYPENCDLKQSDRTIAISSESGSIGIKIDTGLTLADELAPKMNQTFTILLLSLSALMFLISLATRPTSKRTSEV
jgi:hypothetical protein